jgi:uncharacterized membrane protein YkoI
MKQSSALILAAVVTAFVLVVVGGVTATLLQPAPAQTAPGEQAAPVEIQPTAAPAQDAPAEQAAPDAELTADRAALLALDATDGAQLDGTPELVNFEGTTAYEVVLDQGKVYVDAQTGDILHNGAAPAVPASVPAGPVSRQQAIQAATEYVGGGTVREAELEREDGRQVYEVEFVNGSEVYVDAQSGQVVYAELSNRPEREEREHEREHDDEYEGYEGYEGYDDD